jgi:hypothetical protein
VLSLPPSPAGQQWITFAEPTVAFLAPAHFAAHREDEDTVALYPPGDSGITLRFSLHSSALQSQTPVDASEQFVRHYASAHGLELTHLRDRVYLTESQEADWPDRRVLVHHYQIGIGRILIVGSATIWGEDWESMTVRQTLSVVPQIIESFRLA